MNAAVLNKIKKHFEQYRVREYKAGEIITLANEEPKGISFLQSGIVEQYDISLDGNKIAVNLYKPPAFFPMSWAINKTPNTYFFGALTDVRLKVADPQETVKFLQTNPDVLFDLLSRVYKGTDALLRRLALAAHDIATKRLVFELLIEAYRFGKPADENTIVINTKQQDLAARSGLARETVSRELHKLEKLELLQLTDRGISIDLNRLEAQLDFNL